MSTMTKTQKVYLEFSVDYDQDIEDVSVFEVEDQDVVEDVKDVYGFVKNFLNRLVSQVDNFFLSEHRTRVQVWVEDDQMTIHFETFNSPDWSDFDENKIENITPIPFTIEYH